MIIFSFWSRALCWLVILFLLNIHLHYLIKNSWNVSGIGQACGHCIEVRSFTFYLERIWLDFIKPTKKLLKKVLFLVGELFLRIFACVFFLESLRLFSSCFILHRCNYVSEWIVVELSVWEGEQISDRDKHARKASDMLKCRGISAYMAHVDIIISNRIMRLKIIIS